MGWLGPLASVGFVASSPWQAELRPLNQLRDGPTAGNQSVTRRQKRRFSRRVTDRLVTRRHFGRFSRRVTRANMHTQPSQFKKHWNSAILQSRDWAMDARNSLHPVTRRKKRRFRCRVTDRQQIDDSLTCHATTFCPIFTPRDNPQVTIHGRPRAYHPRPLMWPDCCSVFHLIDGKLVETSVLRQKFIDEFTTPQSRFAGQLDPQSRTRCARGLLARRSARTAPTNSSAVCFTVLS